MRRLLIAATLIAATAFVGPASAAQRLTLSEAGGGTFPERSYVLTLPEAQRLSKAHVTVTENGQPVDGLRVSGNGARSAVILAIDASESMHSGAIDDAMQAARAFAAKRGPEQKLGILFFSREQTVALEPTTDEAAIDRVLAEAPPLSKGTRLYDAAEVAIGMIERAEVPTGSVVLLSDGADVGSQVARGDLLAHADRSHVRLFAAGLRSPSYDSSSLRALTASGGTYAEAESGAGLTAIFSRLGERLGREFLITYRSAQPLDTDVAVAVSVSGIADVVTAAYATPGFSTPPAAPDPRPTWWQSTQAMAVIIALGMLLVGLGLWVVLRPARPVLARRIAGFTAGSVATEEEEIAEAQKARARTLLASADTRLSRSRRWQAFELDVELAKLGWSPARIALVTGLITVAVAAGLALTGSYVLATVALVGVPVMTRQGIRYAATRMRRRFEDQLPDNLQVLASALRAGHSFIGALGVMVKDAPEPSQKEFRRVVRDEQLGVPVEQSLQVVHDRMKCEDVIYVGLIATLQRETGGNTAEVLDKVVETMRERGKIRRLVRTLTAQGRLGGWIVTALPVAMIVFLNLFKPNYMDPMLDKVIGWVILVIAGLMVALGAYCIRRIVDIKV